MKHLDKVILDAEICLKLGRYEKVQVLEKIIPQLSNQTYIHEYVLYEELHNEKRNENSDFYSFFSLSIF